MASCSTNNVYIDTSRDSGKEQYVAWLTSIGVSTSGTKDDIVKRENT